MLLQKYDITYSVWLSISYKNSNHVMYCSKSGNSNKSSCTEEVLVEQWGCWTVERAIGVKSSGKANTPLLSGESSAELVLDIS